MLILIPIMFVIFLKLYCLLTIFINYINKNDTQEIKDNPKIRLLVSITSSILVGLLYTKYGLSFNFFKYTVLMIYLIVTGYIDAYSKTVYTFISDIFLAAGLLFLVINITNYNAYLLFYLIGVIGSLIIASIAGFLKVFNWGDVEVLVITSVYIGGFTSILGIFISFGVSAIGSLILVVLRKVNIKDTCSYAPYIAIATYLLLIFVL